MAYFRENEPDEILRQQVLNISPEDEKKENNIYIESDYDDGFDDPEEEPGEELSEDERRGIRMHRFRTAYDVGNIAAVIGGALLILVLLALLMSMIGFVLNDADRNFMLFQTRF